MAEATRDSDRCDAIHGRVMDRGIRHSGSSRFGSVLGECARDEESAGAQKRLAGESMADEAEYLWAVAQFAPAVAGNSQDANVLAAAHIFVDTELRKRWFALQL